jgi:GT2 family glycosyltransferase
MIVSPPAQADPAVRPAEQSASPASALAVSVVVCAYADDRWTALQAAVESVLLQTSPTHELIVVIDHNETLLDRARRRWPAVCVLANEEQRGLSGARNTGVRYATGEIVAFLDDDARADSAWLAVVASAYADTSVIGTGGLARADWRGGRARWFPSEFDWVVGCSYRGLPRGRTAVRNPIGANMSFRRDAVLAVGGFAHGLGRVGRVPLGCEETELAIRVRRAHPGSVVLHLPDACVDHLVTEQRATWSYFRSRCWAEGLSKALVTARVGADEALGSERSYATRTLPAGVLRGIGDAGRGDLLGLARAGAIVAGLAVTAAGYLRGRLALAAPVAEVAR